MLIYIGDPYLQKHTHDNGNTSASPAPSEDTIYYSLFYTLQILNHVNALSTRE